MNLVLASLIGYALGSLPSANALARAQNIDLRREGSGNPGTNNALRVGGLRLAIPVLLLEISKGFASALIGGLVADDPGAIVAGAASVLGNVVNVWYRFRGGKGLAITAGVILAVWPTALVSVIVAIALFAFLTKSSGLAALGAILVLIAVSLAWIASDWPNAWGVEDLTLLPYFAIAIGAILFPKHLIDARDHLTAASRPETRD